MVTSRVTFVFASVAAFSLFSCGPDPVPVHVVGKENPTARAEAVTFDGQIRAIFQNRCSACHHDGGPLPNFLDYATAYSERQVIYQKVVVRKVMPPNNSTGMTEDERELVAEWIDAGAPESLN